MEKKRRLELIVAAFCLIAGLLGCENREPPTQPVIRPVRTEQVFSTGGTRVRTFSGTAQAGFQSRLSFRVPGKVRRVEVKVGDPVKPGQLIAELDPEDYRLQVQEIEASLERARAESRNAEANYSRIRALYENRNASRNELDSARAASESARAQALSLEKRLELVRAQLRYTRLEASTEGTIATVDVEINENVQAGQPVVLLTAGSRPEVVVGVPEILISQVHPGSRVTVSFDAVPHRAFSAAVTEVGVVTGASPTRSSFSLNRTIPTSGPAWRPRSRFPSNPRTGGSFFSCLRWPWGKTGGAATCSSQSPARAAWQGCADIPSRSESSGRAASRCSRASRTGISWSSPG